MESIDKLFDYIINNRTFETILVTGSVGKTTTVGLIKDVISDNVLRIYSKRITPIILKTNIINYLTNDIKYLVLEAGMFFRHHVKYFSDTLKPIIGICLDIVPEWPRYFCRHQQCKIYTYLSIPYNLAQKSKNKIMLN